MNVYEVFTEALENNIFLNRKNEEYNIKNLSHEKGKNILFVIGLSGSGKSTLSNELLKRYDPAMIIETDKFDHAEKDLLIDDISKLSEGDKFMRDYLLQRFPNGTIPKDIGKVRIFMGLMQHIRNYDTNKIFIIEGIRSINEHLPEPVIRNTDPLIIIGTAIYPAAKRAVKRDIENNEPWIKDEKSYYKDRIRLNKYINSRIKVVKKGMKV